MPDNNQRSEKTNKPLFIVFEGIDGSGKSTQARMLADYLTSRGLPVLLTAEPSEGPIGSQIRSLKCRAEPEEEARLFTEDREDHLRRTIIPALEQGSTVICDRYVYSSAAYQGARGIPVERILAENGAFAMPADVTFLIEIDVDTAMKRIASGRANTFTTFEIRSDLEKVDKIYRSLIDPHIIRIDGSGSPEQVHKLIQEGLNDLGCP
ncbi:MAG: dTMP kinase [Desulfomonile tiedjei]|uniref:Thymidylate kinase n=1 Tax=Desulfomonile tiedjei TaxID=2358 RepID=A0A9D6V5Y1_9BACT|nr:dTMP kinase [Desulfomonile tiedjei]